MDDFVAATSTATIWVGSAISAVLLLFGSTYLLTTLRFYTERERFNNPEPGESLEPPQLPYAIPWLGSARDFLSRTPHKFWRNLLAWYGRDAGACTMIMGGEHITMIYNRASISYILKDRKLGRDNFDVMVAKYGLNLSNGEVEKYYQHGIPAKPGEVHPRKQEELLNLEYLLKTDKVNELTAQFAKSMQKDLAEKFRDGPGEVDIFSWLRSLMFKASTTALWGEKVFDVIPDFERYFFQFDSDMLSFFFRFPRWMIPEAYSNRDRILEKLKRWHEAAEQELGSDIADPTTIAWEPILGARITRARHLSYRDRKLLPQSRAGLDLGFLFGLSSNAIPVAGWILMHAIDSTRQKISGKRTLYDHLLTEIKQAQTSDGSLNISILVNQPILLSTTHEVLRLYIDTLVGRQINHDMTVPYSRKKKPDGDVKTFVEGEQMHSLAVKKGTTMMLSTYIAHFDPSAWQSPDFPHHPVPEVFYPYRFLTSVPGEGSEKPEFTTKHAEGTFFPFGGGKTICPGRVFARQEIMAAVAMMMLTFDFEFLEYVDHEGKSSPSFPGLRDMLPGSVAMNPKGDLKVRATRRT